MLEQLREEEPEGLAAKARRKAPWVIHCISYIRNLFIHLHTYIHYFLIIIVIFHNYTNYYLAKLLFTGRGIKIKSVRKEKNCIG